jgi:hypothetical protein
MKIIVIEGCRFKRRCDQGESIIQKGTSRCTGLPHRPAPGKRYQGIHESGRLFIRGVMENQWRGELLTSTDKILGLTRTMKYGGIVPTTARLVRKV